MAIIVKDGGTFEPHPEGQFVGVCVDVVETFGVETQYGLKDKVRLVFQTNDLRDDGRPNMVSASFNASLGDKSRLRPFLEAWRGKKFTPAELKGFDLEKLIGVGALLQVQHTANGDKVYDNISSIMRPVAGMPTVTPTDYTRKKDRPDAAPASVPATHGAPRAVAAVASASPFDHFPEQLEEGDDDLPF